jgi:gliding motility-associated-like protein
MTLDQYNVATCECEHQLLNQIIIPNAFSPNGDLINDEWSIIVPPSATINIKIYNRWGELVFESNDPQATWDGKHRGHEQPIGVYVYVVLYATQQQPNRTDILKGNLTLIR